MTQLKIAPRLGTLSDINVIYTSLKSTFSAKQFRRWQVFLHSFSRCCLPNMRTSANFRENLNLQHFRSSKVDDFGTNRKCIAYATSYLSLIVTLVLSCTVSETRRLIGWKLRSFPPTHSARTLPLLIPLEFYSEVNREETRVMGLLCGESCTINRLWLIHPCDGQTDGRTCRR